MSLLTWEGIHRILPMKESTPPGGLGVALKALRTAAGMTIDDVAEAAGISASYLSRAENEQVSPTASWIQVVAVAIGEHIAQMPNAA